MMTSEGISYRTDFALWWPDYDHKPEACHARVLKRITDMDYAIKACKHRRVCVQAGGHAGLWARRLATRFDRVLTFEPEPKLFACLVRNTADVDNIQASPEALGPERGTVNLRPHASAGSWRVAADGTVPVQQVTIDWLALEHLDAIFLDVEGYELSALRGGEVSLRLYHPVIHVEQLRADDGVAEYLRPLGYRLVHKIHSDRVYKC